MKYKFINEHEIKPYENGFIIFNDRIYANPKEETLLKAGYKELVIDEVPEYNGETQYAEPIYVDGDDVITQSWVIKDIEIPIDEVIENNEGI